MPIFCHFAEEFGRPELGDPRQGCAEREAAWRVFATMAFSSRRNALGAQTRGAMGRSCWNLRPERTHDLCSTASARMHQGRLTSVLKSLPGRAMERSGQDRQTLKSKEACGRSWSRRKNRRRTRPSRRETHRHALHAPGGWRQRDARPVSKLLLVLGMMRSFHFSTDYFAVSAVVSSSTMPCSEARPELVR
jgi:hypothetical protein